MSQEYSIGSICGHKFFHFLVDVIFKTLFQIKVTPHCVQSKMGILGYVSAYFGTV